MGKMPGTRKNCAETGARCLSTRSGPCTRAWAPCPNFGIGTNEKSCSHWCPPGAVPRHCAERGPRPTEWKINATYKWGRFWVFCLQKLFKLNGRKFLRKKSPPVFVFFKLNLRIPSFCRRIKCVRSPRPSPLLLRLLVIMAWETACRCEPFASFRSL